MTLRPAGKDTPRCDVSSWHSTSRTLHVEWAHESQLELVTMNATRDRGRWEWLDSKVERRTTCTSRMLETTSELTLRVSLRLIHSGFEPRPASERGGRGNHRPTERETRRTDNERCMHARPTRGRAHLLLPGHWTIRYVEAIFASDLIHDIHF